MTSTVGGETFDSLYFLKRVLPAIPAKKTVKKIAIPRVVSFRENLIPITNAEVRKIKTNKLDKNDCLFKWDSSFLCSIFCIRYLLRIPCTKQKNKLNDKILAIDYD